MKQGLFKVKENTALTSSIYKMVLEGDTSAITAPGQFVNIALPGRFLRRPISICDAEDNKLTLIYKVVGEGTADMAEMQPETELDILSGLGNGYDTAKAGAAPLLIGGGVGIPPLYMLAKKLISEGLYLKQNIGTEEKKCTKVDICTVAPTVILGFNTASEIFYENEFKELGCRVFVTTVDGGCGIKGYVTNAISQAAEYANSHMQQKTSPLSTAQEYNPDASEVFTSYFTCGPTPMLKAVHMVLKCPGQLSMEERMGCGFGACMGCSIKLRDGYKRVCKDGPVFSSDELLWD